MMEMVLRRRGWIVRRRRGKIKDIADISQISVKTVDCCVHMKYGQGPSTSNREGNIVSTRRARQSPRICGLPKPPAASPRDKLVIPAGGILQKPVNRTTQHNQLKAYIIDSQKIFS